MLSSTTDLPNPYENFCTQILTQTQKQIIESNINSYCETLNADQAKTKKFLVDVVCKALFYDHVLFLKEQSPECKVFEKDKNAFKDITHKCYDAGYSADELSALATIVVQTENRTEVLGNFHAKIHRYDGKYTRSLSPTDCFKKIDLLKEFIKATQMLEESFNKAKALKVSYKDRSGAEAPFQYDFFRMGKKGYKMFPAYVGFFKFVKKHWTSKDPQAVCVKQHAGFLASLFNNLVPNDAMSSKVVHKLTSVDGKNAKKAAKAKLKTL